MLQNRDQFAYNQLTRSLQNVNYSQWERRKKKAEKPDKAEMIQNPPMVFKMPPLTDKYGSIGVESRSEERSESFIVNRPKVKKDVFKTKRQLKEEEEKRAILRLKIRYIREEIERLKIRESELLEINESLLSYISKTEDQANQNVDSILRRYENYQNLKKTAQEKHFEELQVEKKELEELKAKLAGELPKYEESSHEIEEKLLEAQELNRILSVYKNQEYPEKLLQINKLRKELGDLNNLHNEEQQNLQDIINREKEMMKRNRFETTRNITLDISKKALDDMHYSLKDMATFNSSIKEQIEFYKSHLDSLQTKNSQLENEIKSLQNDPRRNQRGSIFKEILTKPKSICTPEMDIFIDYSDEK